MNVAVVTESMCIRNCCVGMAVLGEGKRDPRNVGMHPTMDHTCTGDCADGWPGWGHSYVAFASPIKEIIYKKGKEQETK